MDHGRFLTEHRKGVLITVKRDGRPQSSNVLYQYDDGLLRISVTETRAKTMNLRRDARATLHVTSPDFWRYVVAEGDAELDGPSSSPGDRVGRELAEIYERISGKPHPDWDEFHRAMVDEQRTVLRIRVDHTYGNI